MSLGKAKSLSSTFQAARSDTTWYGSKKSTMNDTNYSSRKFNSTAQASPFSTVNGTTERARMFERISQKEKQIEQFNKEQKVAFKMNEKIKFENHKLEKKGKGLHNERNETHQEPPFEPSLRKLQVPFRNAPEEPGKRCRKPAPPATSFHHTTRNPIVQGEHSQLVKRNQREFTASLQSQQQNFRRFFLPFEWREFTAASSGKNSTQQLRPHTSIKSVLQYEYASN